MKYTLDTECGVLLGLTSLRTLLLELVTALTEEVSAT